MCGRYGFITSGFKTWGLDAKLAGFGDTYNATPGSFLPVLKTDSPLHAELMKWGLVPHWSKTPSVTFSTINARAETVHTSPTFRDAFYYRRCLVPCFGFYEWRNNDDGTKTPFFIHLKNRKFFAMAGIWDSWLDAENKEFKSYAIITTTANEAMAGIHARMPVILSKDDEAVWLHKKTSADMLQDLLIPYRSESMDAYEISPAVNNPLNNNENVLLPIAKHHSCLAQTFTEN